MKNETGNVELEKSNILLIGPTGMYPNIANKFFLHNIL